MKNATFRGAGVHACALAILILGLILCGCQTAPQMAWYRPNTSQARFQQDLAEVQVKVMDFRVQRSQIPRERGGPLQGVIDEIDRRRLEADYIRAYMESKGYELRPVR
jgi:uncharacterized lipoprotein YajG